MKQRLAAFLADTPLTGRTFRRFYAGALGSAFGFAMQGTVAAWLMATLTPSEFMVAMVQSAATVPALIFGLVAGAVSDIFERRSVLLVTQFTLVLTLVALAAGSFAGLVGPTALLVLTFVVGCAMAFYLPAQWASVNDLVGRGQLPRAVALFSVANNVARAAGPALAGALTVWLGAGAGFTGAALCSTVMIFAAWRLRTPRPPSRLRETVFAGMWSGLRFIRHSEMHRALNIRTFAFVFNSAAFWGLLPLVARDLLHLGADGFGFLLTGFGLGAIAAGATIPAQMRKRSLHAIVIRSNLLWSAALVVVAFAPHLLVALIGTALAGAAWVQSLASVSTGAQSNAPDWVRARALSVNFMCVQAGLALGSAVWGAVASSFGVRGALLGSMVGMLFAVLATRRWQLAMGNEADIKLTAPRTDLAYTVEPAPDEGPILIQAEYRVAPEQRAAFLDALFALEPARRRNGASRWGVFRDLEDPTRLTERFMVDSWGEYMRWRQRATAADLEVQDRMVALLMPGTTPVITRMIGMGQEELLPAVERDEPA